MRTLTALALALCSVVLLACGGVTPSTPSTPRQLSTAQRDVLGEWDDDGIKTLERRLVIYRQGGEWFAERTYRSGGSDRLELVEKTAPRAGARRFDRRVGAGGDYYLINAGGDLEVWDGEGLVYTARRIK